MNAVGTEIVRFRVETAEGDIEGEFVFEEDAYQFAASRGLRLIKFTARIVSETVVLEMPRMQRALERRGGRETLMATQEDVVAQARELNAIIKKNGGTVRWIVTMPFDRTTVRVVAYLRAGMPSFFNEIMSTDEALDHFNLQFRRYE